jgi:ribosomal-protein-alanine N-acetyltransferase
VAVVATLHLQTDRLEFRPLVLEDLDEMASMLGDAEALTYWGAPLDRQGARRWIERNLARYEADGFGRCAVIMRATRALVGDCGLITTVVEDQPEVELGWIVRRSHWGMGIATEAGAAWRDFAFDSLGLQRIVSMISTERRIPPGRREARDVGGARGPVGRPSPPDVFTQGGKPRRSRPRRRSSNRPELTVCARR